LNIKGTSTIGSNWNILITNVQSKNIVGSASNKEEPSWEALTATFKTNLVSPGDSIEYEITIENRGNLNAALDKITLSDSNNEAIKYTSSGLEEGSELNAGENTTLTVKVEYDNNVTSQPENTEGTFTVTLDYSQKEGSNNPSELYAAEQLRAKVTDSGDGLYEDITVSGNYIYKGTNPNNYITFNNELWRIISVESDGTLKIIRKESIGNKAFDSKGYRDSTSNGAGGTYCAQGSNGCNAWTISDNFVNGTKSGTVLKDAELNTYLNTTYLGTIKEDSKYIASHDFNVGTPGDTSDTEDIATNIRQEALYKWNGKIGLMNVTDVLKTTSNKSCTSLKAGVNSSSTGYCNTNNWMTPTTGYLWTISPYSTTSYSLWIVGSSVFASNDRALGTYIGVLPVLYLTSEITLDGEGTNTNPYRVVSV
ncbi:MAG: hypothetical protein HFJ25_05795, partial [Clostridia bacterium]|nr:hypothetical protein [Clostridia bacterium]